MSVNVIGNVGTDIKWYDVQDFNQTYTYSIPGLNSYDFIRVRGYAKTGTTVPIITVGVLSDVGTITTFNTVGPATSGVNYSERTQEIASNATRIVLSCPAQVAYVSIEYIRLFQSPTVNPLVYTTSGPVTIPANAQVVLLGGGGAGAGVTTTGAGGAGGAGYIASMAVTPGTYTLIVGSGGQASSGRGSNGGETSFNGLTAAGGIGGFSTVQNSSAAGGAGGSGGGAGTNSGNGAAGGTNGASGVNSGNFSGGVGSTVVPTLFVAGTAGAGATASNASTGGGSYAGGGGGTTAILRNGGSANNFGGGGGGASASSGVPQLGGNGFNGALFVLLSS
jgi:hypothetical protein